MKTLLSAGALCALLTSPALAYFPGQTWQPCDNAPPAWARWQPIGNVIVSYAPTKHMYRACGGSKVSFPATTVFYGCAFQVPGHGRYRVILNNDQTPAEAACSLRYEFSHLPPNNWHDPIREGF